MKIRSLGLAVLIAAVLVGPGPGTLVAQAPPPPQAPAGPPRCSSGPPEHARVTPINNLPNPYETVRNWGTLPDGRKWGSVSAIHVDPDGKHIWAGDAAGSVYGGEVGPVQGITKFIPRLKR